MSLATRLTPIVDPAALEPRWRALEAAADAPSFFLRWTWMGSWLAALQAASIALPRLLTIGGEGGGGGEGDEAAFALIGEGRAPHKAGAVPALWLNQSGNEEGDRPYIEYNGLLCRAGMEDAAGRAFCAAIAARKGWSALHLAGVAPDSELAVLPGIRRRVEVDASPACYVDLDAVRGAGGEYLSLLSANTRSQIRRSLKEEAAAPVIDAAGDAAQVDQWLEDMARLNAGRHEDNAWDAPFFRDFARRLALAGLADGSVEVLRITVAGGVLGYLLNFLWAGRVMNYQSAFAPPRGAKSKPGLMCHAAAIERAAARPDQRLYSFLAGKDRYKQSLATGSETLCWLVLERFDIRLEAEAAARRLLRRP
ncbi:MAG: GNAT family N-acetyltransferase [Sphingobium sp.]